MYYIGKDTSFYQTRLLIHESHIRNPALWRKVKFLKGSRLTGSKLARRRALLNLYTTVLPLYVLMTVVNKQLNL